MAERLTGKRILILEDEYFVAADLKRALTGEGATVLGPTGDLRRALVLADEVVDAAVLDINLGDATAYAVVDRLAARDVPCLLATGYDTWSIPDDYRHLPRVTKPFGTAMVANMLVALVAPVPA